MFMLMALSTKDKVGLGFTAELCRREEDCTIPIRFATNAYYGFGKEPSSADTALFLKERLCYFSEGAGTLYHSITEYRMDERSVSFTVRSDEPRHSNLENHISAAVRPFLANEFVCRPTEDRQGFVATGNFEQLTKLFNMFNKDLDIFANLGPRGAQFCGLDVSEACKAQWESAIVLAAKEDELAEAQAEIARLRAELAAAQAAARPAVPAVVFPAAAAENTQDAAAAATPAI